MYHFKKTFAAHMIKSHALVLPILSGVVCSVIFYLSDFWLGDPLGGAIHGAVPPLKSEHSQSVALVISSYPDAGLTILIGLFVVAGFSLRYDASLRNARPILRLLFLCLFAISSISSLFFATSLKSAYLLQLQFDRVNVLLLQSALNLHLLFLFLSAFAAFALVLISLKGLQSVQAEDQ